MNPNPPRAYNNAEFVSHHEAMQQFMATLNPHAIPNLQNNFPQLSVLDVDAIILQSDIMFGGVNNVRQFLADYLNRYGPMATYLFVNQPIFSYDFRESITPLVCAALWSRNAEMIRVLYQFGGEINRPDQYGLYPEEHYYLPYFNHLSYYICQENIAQPPRRQRIRNEFREVRDEIEIIAGERPPPENWAFPVRLIQLPNHNFHHFNN
jgi:hypothetical protein